jgi:hypothetical protein
MVAIAFEPLDALLRPIHFDVVLGAHHIDGIECVGLSDLADFGIGHEFRAGVFIPQSSVLPKYPSAKHGNFRLEKPYRGSPVPADELSDTQSLRTRCAVDPCYLARSIP